MPKLPGLKGWRERRALSQRELAVRAGVSRLTIMRIEAGLIEPMPRTVRKLATALDVEPFALMQAPEEQFRKAAA